MKGKRIVFIDTISFGLFHEQFNFAFAYALARVYDEIIYYCDPSVIALLQSRLEKESGEMAATFRFRPVNVFQGKMLMKLFTRLNKPAIGNSIAVWRRMRRAKQLTQRIADKHRGDIVMLSMLPPLGLPDSILKRSLPTYIICHGELEMLYSPDKKSLLSPGRIYHQRLHATLTQDAGKGRITLLTPGEAISNNLNNLIPRLSYETKWFRHPYDLAPVSWPSSDETERSGIRLGTIGKMNRRKGFDHLVRLSHMLATELKDGRVSLTVCGGHECQPKEHPLIRFLSPDGGMVETKLMNETIAGMDALLFLYDTTDYKLTASGAIFDAIKYNKPILSVRNDYFEEVAKDCPSGIRIFEDATALQNWIVRLCRGEEQLPTTDYQRLRELYDYKQLQLSI